MNPRGILVSRSARAMISVSSDWAAMYDTASRNRCVQNCAVLSDSRFLPFGIINEAVGLPSTICMVYNKLVKGLFRQTASAYLGHKRKVYIDICI